MPRNARCLDVYQAGRITVLSFGDVELLDQLVLSDIQDEIGQLIGEYSCEVLAFDLTGVRLVPSGMLGMLASLGRLGVEVYLFNPSDEIKEVLEITRLDSILQIRKVDV